jgi:hypothetical protein
MIHTPYSKLQQTTLLPTTVYLMSGGKSSTLAAYYHKRNNPDRDFIYYFNDTLVEDQSTYRFLIESLYFLEDLPVPKLVRRWIDAIPPISVDDLYLIKRTSHLNRLFNRVCEHTGLIREFTVDPWTAFEQARYIGNTRVDVCSRMLKRDPRRKFTDSLVNVEICVGFNWDEMDRYEKALTYESNLIAPLAQDFVDGGKLWETFHAVSGVDQGEAYDYGFDHDNCSGACVKAGLGQWAKLYTHRPNVYLWCETRMKLMMQQNPKLLPFLRKTINGNTRYLSLEEYRINFLERGEPILDDYVSCNACAIL